MAENIKQQLKERSNSTCELCGAQESSTVCDVTPSDGSADKAILICETCFEQINDQNKMDPNHWRCLNDSMWSQVPAVQVMSYRLLKRLTGEGWSQDLLDMMYMDNELKAWADSEENIENDSHGVPGIDSNGAVLNAGDNVTLIKDLGVKGAGFTAKRGTLVKNISLTDGPDNIEGRVNGIRIVLKTCFLKKA
jgi:protein PhnA